MLWSTMGVRWLTLAAAAEYSPAGRPGAAVLLSETLSKVLSTCLGIRASLFGLLRSSIGSGDDMTPESPGWDPDPIFRRIIRKIEGGLGRFMHQSPGVTAK